ncbi:MAG TPA: hypothetical protein VEF72_12070 [Mycobacterium sp.]|nr:hypothetical protein [Mycobacterium sp.]
MSTNLTYRETTQPFHSDFHWLPDHQRREALKRQATRNGCPPACRSCEEAGL